MPDASARTRAELGAALRAARKVAGFDQRELARRTGISQTTITRSERGMEEGVRVLNRGNVTAWLKATNADGDTRDQVLKLLHVVHGDIRSWQDILDKDQHLQEETRQLNANAVLVQSWSPTVLPGMLQTADYARLAIEYTDPDEQMDRVGALATRIAAQGMLREPGRRFEFLVAEHLLLWEPSSGVLTPQLAHLASAAELQTVNLAILPTDYPGVLPEHNFVIREPDDGSTPYVSVEMVHGGAEVKDPEDVAVYQRMWSRLQQAAWRNDDAIARIREEVRRRSP